jgi:hypothetical protein
MRNRNFFLLEVLFFLVIIVLTALLTQPFKARLEAGINTRRDALIKKAEEYTGKKITYKNTGLSVFNTLDVRGLKLEGPGSIPDVEITRLRIPYSFGALISGGGAKSLRRVIIDKPLIRLEIPQADEEDAADKKNALHKTYSELYAFFTAYIPRDFEFIVRNGAFAAAYKEINISANNIYIKIIHGKQTDIESKIHINVKHQNSASSLSLNTALRLKGVFYPETAMLTATTKNIQSNIIDIHKTTLLFLLDDSMFKLQKINDRRPFDISFFYNIQTGTYNAAFYAEDFDPSQMAAFKGALRPYAWALGTHVNGQISLEGTNPFLDGNYSPKFTDMVLSYKIGLNGVLSPNSPMGKSVFTLAAHGTARQVNVQNANLALRDGSINYKGSVAFKPFAPNGTLEIHGFKPNRQTDAAVDGTFMLSSYGRNITIFADSLMLGNVELQGVNTNFIRTNSGYDWQTSALRFIERDNDVHISNIDANGTLDMNGKSMEANVVFNSISLADVFGIMNLAFDTKGLEENFAARSIFFTTEFFFNTDFNHFSYSIPALVTAFQGRRDGFAVSSIFGTDQFFELNSSRFVWNGGSMDMLARADFADANDISFNIDCSFKNISYYLNGTILDKSDVRITGSYGLDILATIKNKGVSGFAKMQSFPLPAGSGVSLLSFDSDFRYISSQIWNVNINQLEIASSNAVTGARIIQISGFANQDGASFPVIFFNKSDGALYGDARFAWTLKAEDRRLAGRLSLNNNDMSERFIVDCRSEYGKLAVRVDTLNLQSGWFYDSPLNVNLSGAFTFSLQDGKTAEENTEVYAPAQSSWDASFDIYSLAMNVPGGSVQLRSRGSIDAYQFNMQETNISYNTIQAHLPYLNIDLRERNFLTELNVDGWVDKRQLRFDAALALEFGEADNWFAFSKMTERIKATLTFSQFNFDTIQAAQPFVFNIEKNRDIISAQGGPDDMFLSRIDNEGNVFISLSKPSPMRGVFLGSIRDGQIDLESSGLYIDMGNIWNFVPAGIIDFTAGIVSADIRIVGPLADPSFYGSANGNNVCLLLPNYINGTVGPAPVTLTFRGAEMVLEPLIAPVEKGEAHIAGIFQFDRWVPRTFNLSIEAGPPTPVPFRIDAAGIKAQGIVYGQINIILEEGSISILGDLYGDNTEITLASGEFIQHERPAEKESTLEVITALTIHTGRKVEFLWPNSRLPILKAVASAGDVITISSNSLSDVFTLKGEVRLRSGEMFYAQRNFYLRSGVLTFNENESQFDPRLSVRAEMRERTSDGNVTISMIVDNQSLLSFSPRLESTPALSQAEILSLLGENIFGTASETASADNRNIITFASTGLEILTQLAGYRRFENFVRDKILHVDMFSARTQALQNLLFFNQMSTQDQNAKNSQNMQNGQLSIGNFFDNTSIYIGKYFGSDMFGQLMLNMRYDENRIYMQGLSLEPEFSLEFNTPFFDIQWQLAIDHFEYLWTDPRAIKDLWLPNNSISIVKRWNLP